MVSSDTGRLKNRIIELKELFFCSPAEVNVIILFCYIYFSGKIDHRQSNQGETLEYQDVFGSYCIFSASILVQTGEKSSGLIGIGEPVSE